MVIKKIEYWMLLIFKFGSWTYDESAINLQNKSSSGQVDSYIKNGEWFLKGKTVYLWLWWFYSPLFDFLSHFFKDVASYPDIVKYECCIERYPFVMFNIHLTRRTLYFVVNLIFPCILSSFMTILGFSLPPDSGEKISLGKNFRLIDR